MTLLLNNAVFADQKVYTNGPLLFVIEDDGNIKIIEYFGDSDTIEVPMAIGEYIVTSIAPGTFKDKNVKSVKLPNTITSIASDAFDDISNIEIKYYDKDDQYVDMDSPIEYGEPEKETDEPKEESKEQEKTLDKETDEPKEESKEQEKTLDKETNEDISIEVIEVEITDAQEDEESLFEEKDTLQDDIKEANNVSSNNGVKTKIDSNNAIKTEIVVNNSSSVYIYMGLGLIGVIIVFVILNRKNNK